MNLNAIIFAISLALCAAPATAQSLSATAIQIDIVDDVAGDEPQMFAAYQPQPDIAPRLNTVAGTSLQTARSHAEGMPQPSIVLGMVGAGQEQDFGIERLLPATVEQVGFDYSDLTARVALRDANPALFKQLIEEGHVDPPEDQLNRTLQSELARMNCYRAGIDGAWGPGSRRSVDAYFDEVTDASWDDRQPSVSLFRTIIQREDVACPTPVAAAPRVSKSSTRKTTQRATTRSKPRRASQQAAAPARKPTVKPKISVGAGIGVFR